MREDPGLASPPPAPSAAARVAARVASGALDPEDQGRIASDVLAHLAALGDAPSRAFGSAKAARLLVQRVASGKAAILAPAGFGDILRRSLLHEGPSVLTTLAVLGFVWLFVAEPRRVPSNSMQPTIGVGDRLIVRKWRGKRMPDRWDVVVFRDQNDDHVLVKRAVGLGGETIEIRNGDFYADDKLIAKPDGMRLAVREPLPVSDPDAPETARGDWVDVVPPCGLRRYAHGLYADDPPYRDENGHLEPRLPPRPLVHDLYLEVDATVRANCAAGLWIEFVDSAGKPANEVRGVAVVATTTGAKAGSYVGNPGFPAEVTPIAFEHAGFADGERVHLEVSYVDGILRAGAGPASGQVAVAAPLGEARIHVQSAGRGLRAFRDLHYTAPVGARFAVNGSYLVPEGTVFFLGDHSSNSRDSRFEEVKSVPLERLIGPVVFRVWPLDRLGPVR